jgi:hypothetical protein
MTWTWETIDRDWLGGNPITFSAGETEEGFNRVERVLGAAWIQKATGGARGVQPTLCVASVGRLLSSLEGVRHPPAFLEKLRHDDMATLAELTGIHLLRRNRLSVEAVVADPLSVPQGLRVEDFRVRDGAGPWIHVEVTRPDPSEVEEQLREAQRRITSAVEGAVGSFALNVCLLREPSNEDIEAICASVPGLCAMAGVQHQELPGLVLLSRGPIDFKLPLVPEAVPRGPRLMTLGGAAVLGGPGGGACQFVISIPYSDDRAEEFLRREAKQLPADAPGLIMIDVGRAPGGLKNWIPLIERRLQPKLHTRVGAVCLFSPRYIVGRGPGEWRVETRVIVNGHAKHPLPAWVAPALEAPAT